MRVTTHASCGVVAALLLLRTHDAVAQLAPVGPSTVRLGIGGEPILWYVPASETTHLGARVFGRLQADVTPIVALRLDLGVGVLDGVASNFTVDRGAKSVPISFRGDVQLNVAPNYAIDVGLDVGVDLYWQNTPQAVVVNPGGDNDVLTTSGKTSNGATGMLGLHVSPATFRFGHYNQFQFAVQEGLLVFTTDGRNPAFEQTVSFAYLFGR